MILEVLANKINQEKGRGIKMGRGASQENQLSLFIGDINIHRKLRRDSMRKLFRIVNGVQQKVWISF